MLGGVALTRGGGGGLAGCMGGADDRRLARATRSEQNRRKLTKTQGHVAGAQLPKINIIMQYEGEWQRKVGQSDNTQRDLSSSNKVGVKIADEKQPGVLIGRKEATM